MDNTYYDRKTDKFIKLKSNKIKVENLVYNNKYKSTWGKLWEYMMHTFESKICLKILGYIRKNKNRCR
jgi:hypothetical protein